MAQRKKKPSEYQIQAIAQAHYKNEFLYKVKSFINRCCGEDIYSLIPPKILDRIYQFRFHSLTMVPATSKSLPGKSLKSLKLLLSDCLKKETLILPQNGLKIILGDYMTVGLTVHTMHRLIKDNDFASASKVRSALINNCTDDEAFICFNQQLFAIFLAMGMYSGNILSGYYWINHEMNIAAKGKFGMENIVKIYLQEPETVRIKINGTIRTATRLGWALPFDGLNWIGLRPSSLNIKNATSDEPMKVYVQSHALLRLAERIDSFDPSLAQYNMYISFLHAKVFCDNSHDLLIEYRIFETKAGYFVVDVVDGIVIVKTFLFLTNNGTPEGALLWKNTGLKMLDKKYLAIDKLSTFITSDIGKFYNLNI